MQLVLERSTVAWTWLRVGSDATFGDSWPTRWSLEPQYGQRGRELEDLAADHPMTLSGVAYELAQRRRCLVRVFDALRSSNHSPSASTVDGLRGRAPVS